MRARPPSQARCTTHFGPAGSTPSSCASPAASSSPSACARCSPTRRFRSRAEAEALLYAAARAQLVQELLAPALGEGTLMLLDRFTDSSLAYQGAGRGLGVDRIRAINEFATGGLQPDRTLLLSLTPELARERLAAEGRRADRLEREPDAFFDEIATAYAQLADAEPERFLVLDASAPPDEVLAAALAALGDLL